MGKENNSDESDFSENEISDLNSLKPFEFEPKTNIGDINSSSSDDQEERAEYKVKRISNAAVRVLANIFKQSLTYIIQSRCQACSFIKKRLQHKCFPMKFKKFLRTLFFTEHWFFTTLVTVLGSEQCKPMKTH